MRIGIIIGSTRQGRIGDSVAQWILEVAQKRDSQATYELVGLAEFNLPFFIGPVPPNQMNGEYSDPAVVAWSEKIASFDGYVFVTPEYNHSVPAPFKNAFDTLSGEWRGKALAFAGYSWGGGVDAVAAWQPVVGGFDMKQADHALSFNNATDWVDGVFTPAEGKEADVNDVLAQIEAAI